MQYNPFVFSWVRLEGPEVSLR